MKKNILIAIVACITSFGAFAQIDRSVPPKPQPNPEINIKIPDVVTTANGMKVIVVENHKLPVVSFQLYVDYPIMPEGEKAGMSEIFGTLLGSGTANNTKDEFDAKVDYMGADIFTNARGFYASSLKKHTPKLLELLSEVVMQPAFPEDEFDRIVNQSISALASEKSDPGSMASNVAATVNYGASHPYGEITTEASLGKITLDDIKSHYKNYFVPNKAYLVIVGDVTPEEANGYVEKYFSKWEKGGEMKQESFEVPTYKGNNVYFVDKPGAVQSQITITHTVDLKPGHEDAIKLRLLNQILGGGSFSAHLMKNLREDKAYTYGCYSQIGSDELVGRFSAGGSFRNEVTDSAVVQILKEIEWMTDNLVADDELSLVKASITGSFARSLEQPRTMANFALNTARYNLPKDYYTTYLTKLEKVTKEELLEVAEKYLQPDNLSIIIVGNEEVAEKLTVFDSNGGMEFKDNYGKEAMQLKKADIPLETVLKNYTYKRVSAGNKDDYDGTMAKFGYLETIYGATFEAMNAEMTISSYKGAPNKTAYIVKVSSPQGDMVAQKEWFNGEAGGKFVAMQGKTTFEGEELADKKNPAFPVEQIHYMNNKKLKVELLGIEEVEGLEYYKVKVQKEGEEEFGFEYYDVKTGWLMIEESFQLDPEGNMVSGSVKYDDYQEVKKGIMVANKMTLLNPGQPPMELTLQKAKVKKKPKAKQFDGEF